MSKLLVTAGWDNVPHLDADTKQRLLEAFPAHERQARTEGVPMLGSGLVFAVDESSITVHPFQVPDYWTRINGIDFGWDHPTGASSLAYDADNDCIYVIKDYSARQTVPAITSMAIKAWGDWIPVSWPHDGLQHDKGSGMALAQQYRAHGLKMLPNHATNAPQEGQKEGEGGNGVEATVQEMLERMMTGRWKVFKTCTNWLEERRTYHRKDGKIVKMKDDVISSSRYARMMLRHAKVKQMEKKPTIQGYRPSDSSMGL